MERGASERSKLENELTKIIEEQKQVKMSWQPDEDFEDLEESGRHPRVRVTSLGMTKQLIRGPTQNAAAVVADWIKRQEEKMADETDIPRGNFGIEAAMRAMAGQTLSTELLAQLTAKEKEQCTRHHDFMALGPVFLKKNQLTTAKALLEDVGGNPGDTWDEVIELLNFVAEVTKERTQEMKKRVVLESEARTWIRRMQAAVQQQALPPRALETPGAVKAGWEDFVKQARLAKERRIAAVGTETKRKAEAANAAVPPTEVKKRTWTEVAMMPITTPVKVMKKLFQDS